MTESIKGFANTGISIPNSFSNAVVLVTRFCIAVAAACGVFLENATAANELVTPHVAKSSYIALAQVDHSNWDTLLTEFVDDDGFVDYKAWKSNSQALSILDGYLQHLASVSMGSSDTVEGRLAYFINAYNAVTVKGILDRYPTKSIRDHTSKLGGFNIWKNLMMPVGDAEYSLETIEHEILRPMNEPRIHFAIVCASIGCPRLLNRAFFPDTVDEQLNEVAVDFVSRPKHFRIDANSGTVYLSKIMEWYGGDFGSNQSQQLTQVAKWLDGPSKQALQSINRPRVRYLSYDWDLNDTVNKK